MLHVRPAGLNTQRRSTASNDASSGIVWRWDGDAFGKGFENGNANNVADREWYAYDLRFPGQQWDAETWGHYNYFRDYDPATGRYVQSDPIGLEGGMNSYLYGSGNPLLWPDPLGLAPYWSTQDVRDFYAGIWSYPRGLYRTLRYTARREGWLGECEAQRSAIEGLIAAQLTALALENSRFRGLIEKGAWAYVRNNKARVA